MDFVKMISVIPHNLTIPTPPHPTKEEILDALQSVFFNDLDFIEEVNNYTYLRKTQLKRRDRKLNPNKDEQN